jgi:hypothetical protein
VSLDWTDEAWRERWAMLARQREAERVEHQAAVDRWMAQLLALDELLADETIGEYGYGNLGGPRCSLYSRDAGRPDLPDHVPDPAALDRDPG